MMGRRKELTPTERAQIVTYHKCGFSERVIARKVNRSKTAVHQAVQAFLTKGHFQSSHPGRQRITQPRDDRLIRKLCLSDPLMPATEIQRQVKHHGVSVSIRTVRNRLKSFDLKSYRVARKPRLTPLMKKRRLDFARDHVSWTVEDWKKVMWSDESNFEQFGIKATRVRRPSGARYKEKFVIPTVKHCPSIMVWASFSAYGRGALVFLEPKERLNAEKYLKILNEKLHCFMTIHQCNIFQQDSAPCHVAKKCQQWFRDQQIPVLPWPGNSADLNPIENLWTVMKKKVSEKSPRSLSELKEAILFVWTHEITPELCLKLVSSMPSRLSSVIANRGGTTKY